MPGYPIVDSDRRIDPDQLHFKVRRVFEKCGMSATDADLLSASLVTADIRGVHSHGVMRVSEYVRKLTHDGVNPTGKPRVVREAGASLVIDGDNSMGQVACHFAMARAIERARTTGVALAAVRGSNHCGALFHYAMMALPEDMIGLAATNALPTMAPWGGRDKILGINPFAAAIPAHSEPPVVLDAAFSGSSHGKIRIYQQKGLPIPEGWAFDREGMPTTDAAAAIHGLLQPIGGHKGTGLALVMGILSSLLSGAAFGTELGNMQDGARPGADGQFVMAIRVDFFEAIDRFKSRVDGIVRQIRESRPAPGFERCYSPGELEALTEIEYRRDGIPLPAETLDSLDAWV